MLTIANLRSNNESVNYYKILDGHTYICTYKYICITIQNRYIKSNRKLNKLITNDKFIPTVTDINLIVFLYKNNEEKEMWIIFA